MGKQKNSISDAAQAEKNQDSICIHIFSVSATLVGVCLTVIGIFRAITELKNFNSVGDNILAFDALLFLISCITSYIALRSTDKQRRRKLERIADSVFMTGLLLMAIVCTLIAYTFI